MILISLVILYLVRGWNVNKCIQALCDISANHVSFSRHFCSNPHIPNINYFPKKPFQDISKEELLGVLEVGVGWIFLIYHSIII